MDSLGWRCKVGIMVPAWNTVCQAELDGMCPVGVTNHIARVPIDAGARGSAAFGASVAEGLEATIPHVASPVPDSIVIAVAAGITEAVTAKIRQATGVPCVTQAEAIRAALTAVGTPGAIAVLAADRTDAALAAEASVLPDGVHVRRQAHLLEAAEPRSFAAVSEDALRRALLDLDGDDVSAILCLGDNLPVARLAGEAELWLGKPVIAANTAAYWHAIRSHGIPDKVAGFGSLLERH